MRIDGGLYDMHLRMKRSRENLLSVPFFQFVTMTGEARVGCLAAYVP